MREGTGRTGDEGVREGTGRTGSERRDREDRE